MGAPDGGEGREGDETADVRQRIPSFPWRRRGNVNVCGPAVNEAAGAVARFGAVV